ncbi:MAG: stage III sporulation protein AE [Lachnospiraceae bacterium]|nr:stage III sporulation protein AE [Lachnospiraceae bacterium]MDE6744762.1 stage III sporulation protein AE [Lachnospiraceae bacterium]
MIGIGYASETGLVESILGEYDFSAANDWLESILPDQGLRIEEMLEQLLYGNLPLKPVELLNMGMECIIGEWAARKELFCVILLCGLLTAVCRNISGLYENKQIMNMGTYLIQALLGSYLMVAFYDIVRIVGESIGRLIELLHVMLPAYFITAGVAVGAGTATGLYEIEMVVIYLLEVLFQLVLCPMVSAAMVLSVMSGITGNESMKYLLKLHNKLFKWILRISMALVGGFSMMQGLFAPVLDGVSYGTAQKLLAALPGLGNITDTTMQMVSGSLLLIKNSIGVVILSLIILVCMIPMARVLFVVLIVHLGSALIGLVTDAGPVTLLERTGNCCMQMFRLLVSAVLLNFMIIAIVASCRI